MAGDRIFTRGFVVVFLATLAHTSGNGLVTSTIALLVVRQLDLSPNLIGLTIGTSAVAALLVRVPLGAAIDRYGARKFAIGGPLLIAGAAMLFRAAGPGQWGTPLVPELPLSVLLGSIVWGFGISTFTTASTTYVANIAPGLHRAEALGYFGVAVTVGQGLGAGFGYSIVASLGFATLYAVTAVACVVAAALVVLLREVHSPRDAAVAPGFGFETKVLVPGVGMVCLIVTVGFGISLVPLMGASRGLDNPGVYFLAYAAASVLGRFAGRLADRDRLRVIVPGMLLTSVAQLVILQATSTASMIVAGCIAGIGVSVAMPALQALAIDLAPPARRGAAVATITAAADVGVLVGTTTAGILLAWVSFGGAFAAAAASPAVGLGVLLLLMRGRAGASGDDVHCSTPLKHSPGRRELEGTLNDVL